MNETKSASEYNYRKEGNVLFNDALNTFYDYMVSDIMDIFSPLFFSPLICPVLYMFFSLSIIFLQHHRFMSFYSTGNVLFNDALNTFYLRLYGIRHMVKDHYDSEKGNPLPPHRLFFPISSKGSFICTIPQTG